MEKSSAEDGDEGSDSDDLDFITSSDESEPSKKKKSESKNKNTVDDLGPSEDSEDDDFDPEGPNSSEDQKIKSNSEESDFTSDSDDFCAEISKSCGKNEVLAPSFPDQTDGVDIMEAELEQDLVLPASSRRQVGRLDYKKLYDVCLFLAFLHTINACFLIFKFLLESIFSVYFWHAVGLKNNAWKEIIAFNCSQEMKAIFFPFFVWVRKKRAFNMRNIFI